MKTLKIPLVRFVGRLTPGGATNEVAIREADGNFVCTLDGNGKDGSIANEIIAACNAHDALVSELTKAEQIILAMLNVMTLDQKSQVAAKLSAQGVSDEGMTRYHERRAALAKAGAA